MTAEPLTPREALKAYLNDRFGYRGPDDGSDPDDFDDDADAILATLDAARKASPPVTNLRAASCPDCTPTVVEVRHEDGCGWATEADDAARKASPPLDVERLADDIEYALGFASHHPACRANAGNDCTCGKDEAVADGKAALDALRAALDPTP